MNSTGETIPQLIGSLGGLHDAALQKLTWHAAESCLEIEIDDLHANFSGLPEYQGPTKATFVFSEVTRLHLEADLTISGLALYDWTFGERRTAQFALEISFSPAGKVTIECGRIECVKGAQAE
jgi:hypothetical protein